MNPPRFTDRNFDIIPYESIPLNRDCFLISDRYIPEFEEEWLKTFAKVPEAKPYEKYMVSWIAIEGRTNQYLELSICIDMHSRFHGMKKRLPRSAIETCVHVFNYEKRCYLFVKDQWIQDFISSSYSVFGLVDAIGIKDLLAKNGGIDAKGLNQLKQGIDTIAKKYSNVLFVSAADGLLLKTNWKINAEIYDFNPERLISLFGDIREVYKEAIDCDVYGIFTQGYNEYSHTDLYHISPEGNHLNIHSLGTSFTQLYEIESQVRKNLRDAVHVGCELYFDRDFAVALCVKDCANIELTGKEYRFESRLAPHADNRYVTAKYEELKKHSRGP